MMIIDDTVKLNELRLRYNTYNQQFELQEYDEVKAFTSNERISKVALSNTVFVNRVFYNAEYFEKGFMEIIYDGDDVKVYKRNLCKLKEGYYNPTVAAGDKNSSYDHYEEFFIMTKDHNNPVKFFHGKSAFLKQLGDKKSKVKSYMKENRLSVRKQEEFIEILKYYETI